MANVRQSVTLYIRWQKPTTNEVIPIRRVLTNCFYAQTQNEIVYRTGNIPSAAVLCQVFIDPVYKLVSPADWRDTSLDELDGTWTTRGGDLNSTFPIMVPYEIDFEFTIGTSSQIITAENNFIRDTPDAIRIVSVQDNMRGTRRSQHMLLRG